MIANYALKTILRRIAADLKAAEVPNHKDGRRYSGYTYDQLNYRINSGTQLSDDDTANIYRVLRRSHPDYAEQFLQLLFTDNSITLGNKAVREKALDKLKDLQLEMLPRSSGQCRFRNLAGRMYSQNNRHRPCDCETLLPSNQQLFS